MKKRLHYFDDIYMQHSPGTMANCVCVCVCACTHEHMSCVCVCACICIVRNPPFIDTPFHCLSLIAGVQMDIYLHWACRKTKAHEISHSSIHQVQVLDSPTKVLFFSVAVPGITSASNHFCRSAPKCESLRN